MKNLMPKFSWNKLILKLTNNKIITRKALINSSSLNGMNNCQYNKNLFILNKYNFCAFNNSENKINLTFKEEHEKEIINQSNNNENLISEKSEKDKDNKLQTERKKRS